MRRTPTYGSWLAMKRRCNDSSLAQYKYYGGRGITVAWPNFEAFYADMGVRPDGHTIDRIDNDGNYEPGNCRWATWTQQCRNKGMQSNNTSGVKGVYWDRGRWRVDIVVAGKKINLGRFATIEAASAARKQGEAEHWGEQ